MFSYNQLVAALSGGFFGFLFTFTLGLALYSSMRNNRRYKLKKTDNVILRIFSMDPSYVENITNPREGDAGFDIKAINDGEILPNSRATINTGLKLEIPYGYVGIVKSRSSLSTIYNIDTAAGVIDSSYRGELKVVLVNNGKNSFTFSKGIKIAQLLIIPYLDLSSNGRIELIENESDLSQTVRSEGGFGSTGQY